jgi:hypothetical protein
MYFCSTYNKPWIAPFSQTSVDYVILDDSHLDAIALASGLQGAFIERLVREVRKEHLEMARRRDEFLDLKETIQQLAAELQRTKADLHGLSAVLHVGKLNATATGDELELAASTALDAAKNVFGENRVQGVETEEEESTESPLSHRVSVLVALDADFDPEVAATREREFFARSVEALSEEILSKVQLSVQYVS